MNYTDAKTLIEWIEKSKYKVTMEEGLVMGRAKNLVLLQRRLPTDLGDKLQEIYRKSST